MDTHPETERRGGKRGGTVQDLLFGHLSEQVCELRVRDPEVRAGDPEAVHKMRVATRRLRSAMATFRPLLDRSVTDPTRDELKWLGGVLGAKRDADVQAERLAAATDELPTELVLGPVSARISLEMGRRRTDAAAQLDIALQSSRYDALLDALAGILSDPPVRQGARRPARKGSRKPLRRAVRRLEKAIAELDRVEGGPDRLVALHDVRKAAKRARYAGEAAEPAWGKDAKRLAKAMEALQDLLGEHQDTVDGRVVLRQIGVNAYLANENGFTFGLLHEREAHRSHEVLAGLPRAVHRASRRDRQTFLR